MYLDAAPPLLYFDRIPPPSFRRRRVVVSDLPRGELRVGVCKRTKSSDNAAMSLLFRLFVLVVLPLLSCKLRSEFLLRGFDCCFRS